MVDFSAAWKINDIEWKYLSYGKVVSALKVVEIFKAHFDHSASVIDLGCGGGGLSHFMNKYIGVDQSHQALSIARQTSQSQDKQFICGDGSNSPIKSNAIDVVLSISMVEHMDEPKKAIQEAFRISKKRGLLIIPCNDMFGFFYDPINFLRKKWGKPVLERGAFGYGHINVLSKSEWAGMIEDAGFHIDDIVPYDVSLLGQIEFFLFSLFTPDSSYEDIPLKILPGGKFKIITRIHKLISIFDIKTKNSFCQAFIVSKKS